MITSTDGQKLIFGLACMYVLAGCTPETPVGPPMTLSLRELGKTASREGTIEIKRTVAYRGRDAAQGAFYVHGQVHFTVDPLENVKQEAYAVSLVLDATLAPVAARFPPCLVHRAAYVVITTAGKNPVLWDERFYVERDDGPIYLFLRFALEFGALRIEEMWIDRPTATPLSDAH